MFLQICFRNVKFENFCLCIYHSFFSLHDEKLGKTKFAENEMAAERTDEMKWWTKWLTERLYLQNEMANEKLYFAERNGERNILLTERNILLPGTKYFILRTKWRTKVFQFEIRTEIISYLAIHFFVPGNNIFRTWQ